MEQNVGMNKLLPILALLFFSFSFSSDKLILLDGSINEGEFITFQGDNIIFKPINSKVGQAVRIEIVKSLTLSDGTIVPIKISNTDNPNIYLAGEKLIWASEKLLVSFLLPIAATQFKMHPDTYLAICLISAISYVSGLFDLNKAGDILMDGSESEQPNNE